MKTLFEKLKEDCKIQLQENKQEYPNTVERLEKALNYKRFLIDLTIEESALLLMHCYPSGQSKVLTYENVESLFTE